MSEFGQPFGYYPPLAPESRSLPLPPPIRHETFPYPVGFRRVLAVGETWSGNFTAELTLCVARIVVEPRAAKWFTVERLTQGPRILLDGSVPLSWFDSVHRTDTRKPLRVEFRTMRPAEKLIWQICNTSKRSRTCFFTLDCIGQTP